MKILRNNGIMRNAPVNVLTIENTNTFTFGFVSTGPIRISWGDGSYVDILAKATRYNASKNYVSVGNWNITITGVENITELYFEHSSCLKINTNIAWIKQFTKLNYISIVNASFNGEIGAVIDGIKSLEKLQVSVSVAIPLTFNVSNCKSFWQRCKYIIFSSAYNIGSGSFSDIDINLECTYINFYYLRITGSLVGIIKNGYTKLTQIYVHTYITQTFPFQNISDWIIPDSLIVISRLGDSANYGDLNTFNFKNLQSFYVPGGFLSPLDLRNNQSFIYAIQNTLNIFILNSLGNTYTYLDLSIFTKASYEHVNISTNRGYNKCYGDITNLAKKITSQFVLMGGLNDGAIYGTIDTTYKANYLQLSYVDVTIADSTLLYLATKAALLLTNLPNLTGNISNCNFSYEYPPVGITIAQMPNLYADITTFSFNTNYINTSYSEIAFHTNPNFTGNLENFPLWKNKYKITLYNCSYTGIPGFIRKIFTNRNTCLKATGGTTTISVQGNVDNNLLTGNLQQPPLGSYTGNINNLTEVQIDFLAQGLDYTGTGISTPWTDKEKIWFLTTCYNSSTDSSKRYRVTISV